ncbi:MAG: WD40 repeat domain-containing protein [Phycisphaerales bacterium]|nr:WD40 repeat domain-containing protein [Phycisphaerales bacterium]
MPARTAITALCLAASHLLAQSTSDFASYQAHMAAAEKSLRLGESRELTRWLGAAPAEFRGWEWRCLNAIADSSLSATTAPATPIRLAISPAADRLATVEGSLVRLWSWPDLRPAGTIEGHADAIYRAEFDPSGNRLITVSRDVTSRVWDLATGAEIARIDLSNPAFAAAAFSPDGATAATCAWERDDEGVHGVVWLWDPATGEVRQKQRVGVKPLSAIRYSPDGSAILVGSWDGLVHVLDTEGAETGRITLPDRGVYNAVNDIAIDPRGELVAAGTKDRTTTVFRIDTGEPVATLAGHGGYIEGVTFSPDGLTLATASGDTTVRLWNTADWSEVGVLRGHQNTVRGSVFAGASLVTCSQDDTLRQWDLGARHAEQLTIDAGIQGTYSAALSPDGSTLAIACHDGALRIFDARTGVPLSSWEAHPGSTCHAANFSADGSRLITCSWDKTARVWAMPSHEPIATLDAGDGVYFATLSPDGALAATAGDELLLWTVAGTTITARVAVENAAPRRAAFSPDGKTIASGWSDGSARLHDAHTGEQLALFEPDDSAIETVAFSPDGSRLISGDGSGSVRMFSVADARELWACDTGDRAVNHVAMHADRIAVATDHLLLLDAARGGPVLERTPLEDALWHLSWSPDGATLAVCSTNGTAAVLTAPPLSAPSAAR